MEDDLPIPVLYDNLLKVYAYIIMISSRAKDNILNNRKSVCLCPFSF